MRCSYSQGNTFKKCPEHWSKRYKERYVAPNEGASIYFGSAVDDSFTEMLNGSVDYIKTFHNKWHTQSNFGKTTVIYDNPNIVYGYADFDADILSDQDMLDIMDWAVDLGVANLGSHSADGVEIYKEIVKKRSIDCY